MTSVLFIAVGLFSGLVLGVVFSKVGVAYARWPYALTIALAAALYPLLQTGPITETWGWAFWISLGLFLVPALIGLFRSPWWIAWGLILHSFFDIIAGFAGVSQWVGPFYAPWCAGLDLALGLLFVFRVCVTPETRVSRG